MNKYSLTIKWSEEDAEYVATCTEFPGLSAFGVTRADALREAEVALRLFIESYQAGNLPLPTPDEVKP